MPEDVAGLEGAVPAASAPEGAPAPAAAPSAEPLVETFDRPYVEKLRAEAAEHRTKAKTYEQAFDGWTSDDQQVWLEAVRTAAADPAKGAEYLRKIAETLSPAEQQAVEEKFLTESQLNERLDRERLETETTQQLRSIKAEAAGLGYEDGSEDYFRLMWVAQNKTNLDLSKADAHIKADRQRVIDEFVEQKRQQANGPRVTTGGSSASEEKPIRTFKDAKASLEARLKAESW